MCLFNLLNKDGGQFKGFFDILSIKTKVVVPKLIISLFSLKVSYSNLILTVGKIGILQEIISLSS